MPVSKYKITLHSPMGLKDGKLTLIEDGASLSGVLSLLGCESSFGGGSIEDGRYSFHARLITPLGDVPCRVEGEIFGDMLVGVSHSGKGSMSITGKRINE